MKLLVLIVVGIFLVSCGGGSLSSQKESSWYKPTTDTSWQWQLLGKVNSSYDVDIYDIDLFDSNSSLIGALKADGKKVICYFSAGSFENWREDKEQFPASVIGKELDGWEGEKWLDISKNEVKYIMKKRLDLAVQKGCDGVEPDNIDGYENDSGFALSAKEQLDFNKFIAKEAHSRGLSVGLKNDLEQILELESFFDFAVNEQCQFLGGCQMLKPFIDANKPVFNAEYASIYADNKQRRNSMCENAITMKFQTLVLPMTLDDTFRFSCD